MLMDKKKLIPNLFQDLKQELHQRDPQRSKLLYVYRMDNTHKTLPIIYKKDRGFNYIFTSLSKLLIEILMAGLIFKISQLTSLET